MQCQNNHLDDIEDLPGNEHIIPVGESNSVPPLSSIGILSDEFTIFKTFICQKLTFIQQELSDSEQKNKSDKRNFNYEACHKNTLDEKIVLVESNSFFLLQELHNKQITVEKRLVNVSSNSDKVKFLKHLFFCKSKAKGTA